MKELGQLNLDNKEWVGETGTRETVFEYSELLSGRGNKLCFAAESRTGRLQGYCYDS
jgi:hypothetical protein